MSDRRRGNGDLANFRGRDANAMVRLGWERIPFDLKGKTFGWWRVLRYVGPGKASPRWACRCVRCGAEREILGAHLRNRPPGCGPCSIAKPVSAP